MKRKPAPLIEPEEKESKKPYRLTREERETIITRSDASDTWNVFTCSPPVMRRIDKWAKAINEERIGGEVVSKEYEVPKSCVSIHKPRKVTDAMRQRGLALSMERATPPSEAPN
jgi:hypothetical protein